MSKMNVKWSVGILVLMALVAGGLQARAQIAEGEQSVCSFGQNPASGADAEGGYSTCGGEIPWPFQVSNQAVELADGERYLLMGSVEVTDGKAYFLVDLQKHAWLAGSRRKANPRYPLKGDETYWLQYAGKRVRLVAMAKWIVFRDPAMRGYRVDVILQSLADPAVSNRPGQGGATTRPREH
jgi:hypothetical protein